MKRGKRHMAKQAKHHARMHHRPRSRRSTLITGESDERNANVQQSADHLEQPEQSMTHEGGPPKDYGIGE